MDDLALQQRLDAALILLAANFLLLFLIGLEFVPEASVGVAVLGALIGYGHLKRD
jgi:hypothetical protein